MVGDKVYFSVKSSYVFLCSGNSISFPFKEIWSPTTLFKVFFLAWEAGEFLILMGL